MKKQFTVHGKICEVIVALNNTSITLTGTNAITHDDYSKQVDAHTVRAFVDGQQVFQDKVRADRESDLETMVFNAEVAAKQHANLRVVHPDTSTARTILTRLGYSE